MGQRINQKGIQGVFWTEWKWKRNQSVWDVTIRVLRSKFIALNAYTGKKRKISNQWPPLLPWEIRKIKRRKKIIIRIEIKEIEENIKMIVRITEKKSWFFEKIDKIEKPLAIFISIKREKT